MNGSGGIGILGVIVGAVIVVGVLYFAFGERMGFRTSGPTVHVEAPRVPATK